MANKSPSAASTQPPQAPQSDANAATGATATATPRAATPEPAPNPAARSRVRSDYPTFDGEHWATLCVLQGGPYNGHDKDTIQTRVEQILRRQRKLADGQGIQLGQVYEDLLDKVVAYAECCTHEGVKHPKGTRVRLTGAGIRAVQLYRQDPAAAAAMIDKAGEIDPANGAGGEEEVDDDGNLKRRA